MVFDDVVIYLRALLDDFELPDPATGEMIQPEYTDEALGTLVAIGIRQIQVALSIPNEYRVPTTLTPPFVDPTIDIEDWFVELVLLNVLCRLQKRNVELQFGMDIISTKIGPVDLKIGNAQWGNMPKWIWESTSPCVELEKKLTAAMLFDVRKLRAVHAILPGRGSTLADLGFDPRASGETRTGFNSNMVR